MGGYLQLILLVLGNVQNFNIRLALVNSELHFHGKGNDSLFGDSREVVHKQAHDVKCCTKQKRSCARVEKRAQ